MNASPLLRALCAPLLLVAAALAACGDGGGGTGSQTVASVEVTGPTSPLETGASAQLTAVVKDERGRTIARQVTWSSSSPQVASVDGAGQVQGMGAGAARITATADGKTGGLDVTVVLPQVASVTITPDPVSVHANEEVALSATLRSAAGAVISDRFAEWASADTSIAVVDALGRVTGRSVGKTAITASLEGKSDQVEVTVLAARLNFSISGLYVNQSVQRTDGSVPLVAGRAGLLRVFGRATQQNAGAPGVRVRFFRGGAQVDERVIPAGQQGVVTTVSEGELATSWNVLLPGSLVQPGLSVLAEINPGGTEPEDDLTDNRFPASGQPLALDVRTVPPFRVRFVPVFQNQGGRTGDVSAASLDEYLSVLRRVYPLADIQASVRATFTSNAPELTDSEAWKSLLGEIDAVRVAEGAPNEYYYGVARRVSGGTAGIGYIGRPTAVGYDGQIRAQVYAHEAGHNFARRHASCGQGEGNPDLGYPYAGGVIGVHGYDVFANQPKSPGLRDLMTYCYEWISDYTYTQVMDSLISWGATRGAAAGAFAAPAAAPQPSLLVWGRTARGRVELAPAFQVTTRPVLPAREGPYTVQGVDAAGRVVFSLRFAPDVVADVPGEEAHFAFAVPLSPEQMAQVASLRLSGNGRQAERRPAPARELAPGRPDEAPGRALSSARRSGGRVGLRWDAARHPMVMVRDADTGEVLSFARGGDVSVAARARRLELVFSDGVRSHTERVEVPAS